MTWKEEYREHQQLEEIARYLALKVTQAGLLPCPNACSRCGLVKKIDGHHDDYSYPFRLMRLCHKCHGVRHSELNRIGGTKYGRVRLADAPPEVRERIYAAIRIADLPFVREGLRQWRQRKQSATPKEINP